jgi:hypothetical protein
VPPCRNFRQRSRIQKWGFFICLSVHAVEEVAFALRRERVLALKCVGPTLTNGITPMSLKRALR